MREPYPLYLKVRGDIGDGTTQSTRGENYLVNSFGAIEIDIKVGSGDYPKEELYEAVKETAMKAVEYFR